MAPALTHVALQVRDLEASIAFYREFCGMHLSHERKDDAGRVAWVAEPGHEEAFVFVLIERAGHRPQPDDDFGHLGFALDSRAAVDTIAARAGENLVWPPGDHPYPTGYFCGVRDPDGNIVEFSFGQPLRPERL